MYKWQNNKTAVIDKVKQVKIPKVVGNRHWKRVLLWISKGNEPDDEYTLDERRDNRISKLNAVKIGKLRRGKPYLGARFDALQNSLSAINSKLRAMGRGRFLKVKWLAKNNVHVEMDKNQMEALHDLLEDYTEACYTNTVKIIDTIKASNTPETVDIDNGWPSSD